MKETSPTSRPDLGRRSLLGASVAAAVGSVAGTRAWAQGSDAPEKPSIKLSFLPVSDCAVSVMAGVLETGKKYGLKIELVKDTGPATQRDKLQSGEVDAAGNALQGQFQAQQLGIGGSQMDFAILMNGCYNGQGITASTQLLEKGVVDGASLAALIAKEKREYKVAHTFPTGCHSMWLNYWLAANSIHPMSDVRTLPIPGPQMVANMRVGNMDVFCAGEPLSGRAVVDQIGFTLATSQQIWPDHPEKVLVTTAEFANRYPRTAAALVAAMLDAAKHVDADANRAKVCEILADKAYVNNPLDTIAPRFLGDYDDGRGRKWKDKHRVAFFGDGAVTQPLVSDTLWFLTQHQRWKMTTAPSAQLLETARKVVRADIYAKGAAMAKVPLSKNEGRKATLIDGVVWDPAKFEGYASGFKIKA